VVDHPTPSALEAFLRGALSIGETKLVITHLLTGCGQCRKAMEPLAQVLFFPGRAEPEGNGAEYDFPIFRAINQARRQTELERTETAAPAAPLADTQVQPVGVAPHIASSLRSAEGCEALLAASRELRHQDPEAMVFLAALAVGVAERLDPRTSSMESVSDLRARAWAELGNAHRITEGFGRAEECFKEAMLCLGRGSGQPELRAAVLDLHASLDRAQRRFKQAFRRLDEVYAIYVKLGDFHLAGRALVKKGIAKFYANEAEAAIPLIRSGLNWLEQVRDPGLYVTAVHNLACSLVETQRFVDGRTLIEEHQNLFIKHAGPLLILRLRWNEAKIAAGLGEASTAEAIFQQVRQAFADRKLAFVSALVSLDLAALFREQGRTCEVAALATEMVATFRRLRIRREAIAALLLLERAARQERATLALLRHVASRLRELEHGPRG